MIAYLAFLGTLMATGIDISLPAFDEIDADLNAGNNESLIVTVFFLGAAFGQLVTGPVSDAVGRRPTLVVGIGIYLVGAVLSAIATSFSMLLVARFIWGLGAAAPAGTRTAIARDLYSGDAMARITTVMMAVFLLGPIFTPLIGEALLQFGSWRLVFWFPALLGIGGLVAVSWFGETLRPELRRSFARADFGNAVRAIWSTRVTFGHIMATVFWSAAFFVFLSSSPIVWDRVYDRESSFAFSFALLGALTIPLLLANNVVIKQVGARAASLASASVSLVASIIGAVVVVAIDAAPNFWLFYVWLVFASSFITLSSPPMFALALEPMEAIAGTVSAIMFFTGFAVGSTLAAFVGPMIGDTITPFVLAFAIFGSIGFGFQVWAGPNVRASVTQARTPSAVTS